MRLGKLVLPLLMLTLTSCGYRLAARKGDRARYVGARKNLFDLRRAATIQNLVAQQRVDRDAA